MNEENKKKVNNEIPKLPAMVLTAIRNLQAIKQENFAIELNVSQSQLKHMENARQAIGNEPALKLEKMTGINYKFWRSGKGFMHSFKDSLKKRETPITNFYDDFYKYYPDWLYCIKKTNGLKAKDMADIIGINEKTFNKLSIGDSKPEFADIIKTHIAFEIPLDYFSKDPKIYATQIAEETDKETLAYGIDNNILMKMITNYR